MWPIQLAFRLLISVGFTHFTGHEGPYGELRYSSTLFLDLSTSREWGVSVTPRPLSTPQKEPVPIVPEAGWATGPVWAGAENLAPNGIRFLDRPTCSQSLYRLSYRAHHLLISCRIFLCSLTLSNSSSFLTRSVQLIFSIILQHHISKLSRCF
jgi:hypothetical protein